MALKLASPYFQLHLLCIPQKVERFLNYHNSWSINCTILWQYVLAYCECINCSCYSSAWCNSLRGGWGVLSKDPDQSVTKLSQQHQAWPCLTVNDSTSSGRHFQTKGCPSSSSEGFFENWHRKIITSSNTTRKHVLSSQQTTNKLRDYDFTMFSVMTALNTKVEEQGSDQ